MFGLLSPLFGRARGRRVTRARSTGPTVEALETRDTPSVAPAGPEFRVNTSTLGDQETSTGSRQSVAMDATGDYVSTWSSAGEDGSGFGVYVRRFNAAGVALGREFRVNTSTWGDQNEPAVAMDARGDFVIAWHSLVSDAYEGIYAQRYDAAGVAQGSLFLDR
jgi:hypothetical protein